MAIKTPAQIEYEFNKILIDIENYFTGKPLTVGLKGIRKQIAELKYSLEDYQLDEIYNLLDSYFPWMNITYRVVYSKRLPCFKLNEIEQIENDTAIMLLNKLTMKRHQ
jgi:hypothetical protein